MRNNPRNYPRSGLHWRETAAYSWDEAHALEIFQRLGAAEAPDLLADVDALTGRHHRDR